jgi:hypothetical protein
VRIDRAARGAPTNGEGPTGPVGRAVSAERSIRVRAAVPTLSP